MWASTASPAGIPIASSPTTTGSATALKELNTRNNANKDVPRIARNAIVTQYAVKSHQFAFFSIFFAVS